MSNRVYTYSAKDYRIIVGGFSISGLYSGSFIEVAYDETLYNKILGCDGRNTRARNISRAGTITINLARTSPSNDVLSGILLVDEATNGGVIPIFLKDSKGLTTVFSLSSWIREVPILQDSTEIERRTWVFDCSRVNIFVGGNEWRTGTNVRVGTRGGENPVNPDEPQVLLPPDPEF